MKDRKILGIGLVMIGMAVLGAVAFYVSNWKQQQVIAQAVPPPEANWLLVFATAIAGVGVLKAGILLLKPNAGQMFIAIGVAVTLFGVFEYWLDEMFIAVDGQPNVNWAVTAPITALGLALLAGGIYKHRRQED